MLASETHRHDTDDDYGVFSARLCSRFGGVVAAGGPLFTTDASELFAAFLAALPDVDRQHYNCHACRRFVDTYGGIVSIDAAGKASPVFWLADVTIPEVFRAAVRVVERKVTRAKVTGVFLTSERVWGQPVTGAWRHMAVTPPPALVFKATTLRTAFQAAAERREDYGTLCRGLAEFSAEHVAQAVTLLSSEVLYRSEKCLGVAKWLADLHTARASAKGAARNNVTWRAVAMAPAGWAHVRSTMIGTLLEDLAAGLPFEDVKRKFGAKMNPLQYLRPTAPPSAGNIAQAEKVVAALESAGALARRFALLSDIRPFWTPTAVVETPPAGGVFGHLKARGTTHSASLDMPPVVLTWEKFARTVLPDALTIEALVPHGAAHFYAFVTAANPDAPPILQWDREDSRNPVSWYTYSGGSVASRWGLVPGSWAKVNALTLFPHQWGPTPATNQGDGVLLVLDGAHDTGITTGAGFFPESLRSEYHGVRATMEAYAAAATIAGRDEAGACGLALRKGQPSGVRVRVTTKSGPAVVYHFDRWD